MPISTPQDAFRFRVVFPGIPEAQFGHITQNVDNMTLDMVAKTVTVIVRQSIEREMFEAINYVLDRNAVPDIEFLNTCGDANFAVRLHQGKLASHKLLASYSDTKYLKHEFVWSFRHLDTCSHAHLSSPAEVKGGDPTFLTPAEAMEKLKEKQADKPADPVQ